MKKLLAILFTAVFTFSAFAADGDLDTSFGTGGFVNENFQGITSRHNSVVVQPDGKIISAGDKAVRGDFDGDAKLDAAIYRASNQTWYIRNSSNGQTTYTQFGLPTDKRISGDFDGDGKTDFAVFRDGIYYVLNSGNSSVSYQNFGTSGDQTVASAYVQ